MTKIDPAPNNSVGLIFKLADDHYRVFVTTSWKVQASHFVDLTADGNYTCDCSLFRFEAKCSHSAAVASTCHHETRGKNDENYLATPIDWRADEPFQRVLVLRADGMSTAAVPYDVGDLSLFDLLWLCVEGKTTDEISKKMVDEDSYLNPKRIYTECLVSVDKGISSVDDAVKSAGLAIPPLTKTDVPVDDYDDSLTAVPEDTAIPTPHVADSAGVAPIDWKTVQMPNPSKFYVQREVWEQLCYTVAFGGNALLTGPSGCGKSELTYLIAKAFKSTCEAFNFGATQEPRAMLIGNTHFDKSKGTWFAESRFVRAIKQDRGVVLLDELTRDRGASAHNIILTLLDRQGYLALDESEDIPIIHKGDGVSFIGTANIGSQYTGTEALDAALRNRFGSIIDLTWPPKEKEIKILMDRCPGLRAGMASKLADLAKRQREMHNLEGEFMEGGEVSTRMLIEAGARIAQGMSLENALTFSILNHFPSDGGNSGERVMLKQLFQKNS